MSEEKEIITGSKAGYSLLDLAVQNIDEAERKQLVSRALEEKLKLDVESARASERHARASCDMAETERHIRSLEASTKSDYTIKATYETASGKIEETVKKSDQTALIIIVVAVALVLFFVFAK